MHMPRPGPFKIGANADAGVSTPNMQIDFRKEAGGREWSGGIIVPADGEESVVALND